jgi:hypothetical protein
LDKLDFNNPKILEYNGYITIYDGNKWKDLDIKEKLRPITRRRIQRIIMNDKYDYKRKFFKIIDMWLIGYKKMDKILME